MINSLMLDFGRRSSTIRDLFEYGNAQKKIVGEDNVFDFSLGNPSVPPPKEVSEAIIDIVEHESAIKVHGYTTSAGNNETRDAIAAHLSKVYDRPFDRHNIFLTCGAAAALTSCIKAFLLDSTSEILAISPYFPEYERFVVGLGGVFKAAPARTSDFQVDLPVFESMIGPKTQAVIINSPNNPSGAVYTEGTLRGVADALTRKSSEYGHPIYLMSDEPYRELVYDGLKVPFVPDFYTNTIICYSYSKSLSLPGDRIGYMLVTDNMDDFDGVCWATAGAARSMGYVCAPALIQKVIARCADVPTDIESYDRNRRLLYGELVKMGYDCVHPDGAFYLFVKAPNGYSSKMFSNLAKKQNLLLVPGDDFGCPGYLRVSYCVSYDMIRRSLPTFKKLIDMK
ncbi:MAG: pyridoxal phosphate-dependent aminotransferase [Sphaerochaetaceae bacterium]|nr:pyridoxal phosphate-dependent aminotransferase [Sphaerochaetaceae bacterium]MDD4007862.1 pyridoxal phosphate-dependent aminotransferase [Sphaerochaetaceae bacterium]MDD4397060.1 pyridoxal phosphate-dependent aminotransferase [Sphaerochaetaceae bacterium]